uniref:Secreted protein n=1 Tax=Panagrellus redivivus TaxID=6233 RepID=A0A7E4W3M0_PANRE
MTWRGARQALNMNMASSLCQVFIHAYCIAILSSCLPQISSSRMSVNINDASWCRSPVLAVLMSNRLLRFAPIKRKACFFSDVYGSDDVSKTVVKKMSSAPVIPLSLPLKQKAEMTLPGRKTTKSCGFLLHFRGRRRSLVSISENGKRHPA